VCRRSKFVREREKQNDMELGRVSDGVETREEGGRRGGGWPDDLHRNGSRFKGSSNERRVGVLGKRAAAFDGLRHDAIVRLGGCEGRAGGDRAHGASGQPACLAGG